MISDVFLVVGSFIFILLFVLQLLHYEKFKLLTAAIANIVEVSFILLRILLSGILKSIVFLLITFIIIILTVVSKSIHIFGEFIISLVAIISQYGNTENYTIHLHSFRELLIEEGVDRIDDDITYDNSEQYRTELRDVLAKGKNRLSTGETTLALFVGLTITILYIINIYNLASIEMSENVSIIIQILLVVIGISVIYRRYIVDILAFNSYDDFSALEEYEVAFRYQKAIALSELVQIGFVIMGLVSYISSTENNTLNRILSESIKEDTIIEKFRTAYKEYMNDK